VFLSLFIIIYAPLFGSLFWVFLACLYCRLCPYLVFVGCEVLVAVWVAVLVAILVFLCVFTFPGFLSKTACVLTIFGQNAGE